MVGRDQYGSQVIEVARHWTWRSPAYETQWRDMYVAAVISASRVLGRGDVVSVGEWFDFRDPESPLVEGGWNFERPWRKKGWFFETSGHWHAWILVPPDAFASALNPVWSLSTEPSWLLTGAGSPGPVTDHDEAERAAAASGVRAEMSDTDYLSVMCRQGPDLSDPAATLEAITQQVEDAARERGVEIRKRRDEVTS
jgi:hypothetical protein